MSYTLDLSGRVALITGASSGLGKQFALTLAKAGAAVVLAGRRVELLKDLRSEIEASGGDAHVVGLDVTDVNSIRSAVAHAETEVGPIDILINNSGVSTTERLVDVTEESYDYVFDTNTRGSFFVAQEVAKRMLARAKGAAPGTYTGGRIVNIASAAGLRALPQIGVYCMSKAPGIPQTKGMAAERGRIQTTHHPLSPGTTPPRSPEPHWETEAGKKLVSILPRKRVGQPKDLDALLVMLCSAQSDFINGSIISADDGIAAA